MGHRISVALSDVSRTMRTQSIAPKVLLYSHDTFGLGNIRRTLLLAEMLSLHYPAASLLIVTGSPMIHAFRIPPRTDYIKLPCLTRSDADRYDPAYLGSQQSEVAGMRRGVLEQTILGFAPDLMIVDKRAAGIGGELLAPLRALRRARAPAKLVLGIRDILDVPTQTRLSLKRARDMRTIARYYHGSAALFWRDSALERRNAFAAAPADTSRTLNEGTLGGPLPGHGWSFFTSGQHLVDNDAAIVNARTPSGPIVQNVSTPERRSTVFGRADFRPNKTDALTLRYDLFDDLERNHGVGGFRLAEQAYTTGERRHRFQANDHRIFAGGVLNDLRIEAARSARADGVRPQSASVVVAGAFTGGPSQIFASDRSVSVQAQDITSVMIAAHAVRLGARLKTRWQEVTDAENFGGTYQFQSLGDYVRGAPFLFVRRSGCSAVSFNTVDGDAFVETSFRPAPSVGVTAGMRYEWQTRVADSNNFAPRLSAAFAPADRKIVFRGGVGVFYQSLPEQAVARALLFGDGGLREVVTAEPSFPIPPPGAAGASAPTASWILAPGLQLPATVQTSVSAERALWRKTSVTAEYLLLRGYHALRARDVNAPLRQARGRPDPTRLNVFQIESTGAGRTDALTLTFRGRLAGFRGTIQYTLSRNIDDTSGAFDLPADNDNLDAERGRADFDRRHKFNLAGTYGWRKDRLRLGGVLALSSGAPFEILIGGDTNHDLVANDRPAGITRNQGDGPGFAQLDLRFTTVMRLPRPPSKDPESAKREQIDNLELNVDLFNAFDRVNPTTFVGVITSPLFGRANAARPARTAQLSLRYRF